MAISGKVALVTGAAQGIGLAISKRLASDGARIALMDLNREALDAAAEVVAAEGVEVSTILADVSKRQQVSDAIDQTQRELGGFDIMVNNAGIAQVQPIEAITEEEMDLIHAVNVKGTLWGIQLAAAKFKSSGSKGKIISAASIAAHEGYPMLALIAQASLQFER